MEVIIRQHEQECGVTVADIFDRAVTSGATHSGSGDGFVTALGLPGADS